MGNTVLSTYIVDNYPEYANEVITFYSVMINVSTIIHSFFNSRIPPVLPSRADPLTHVQMSAFINPWFIFYWVEASGYTWTFAAQCIICSFGIIPIYLFLQRYGPRLRSSRPMYMKRLDGRELAGVPVEGGSETVVAINGGVVEVKK